MRETGDEQIRVGKSLISNQAGGQFAMTRFMTQAGYLAAVFISYSMSTGLAAAGDSSACPGADVVEAELTHGTTSGYYVPGLRLVVLNKTILNNQAKAVQHFIAAHECAHADSNVGNDELAADCAAAKRGVSEGWLGKSELIQVCAHIAKLGVDATHPPVNVRCANIRYCMRPPQVDAKNITPLNPGWRMAQQQ
jgi:hypothetical protein